MDFGDASAGGDGYLAPPPKPPPRAVLIRMHPVLGEMPLEDAERIVQEAVSLPWARQRIACATVRVVTIAGAVSLLIGYSAWVVLELLFTRMDDNNVAAPNTGTRVLALLVGAALGMLMFAVVFRRGSRISAVKARAAAVRRRLRTDICGRCEYSLRTLFHDADGALTCPECGLRIPLTKMQLAARSQRPLA